MIRQGIGTPLESLLYHSLPVAHLKSTMPQCRYCLRWLPTQKSLTHHQAGTLHCRTQWESEMVEKFKQIPNFDPFSPEDIPRHDEPEGGYNSPTQDELDIADQHIDPPTIHPMSPATPPSNKQPATTQLMGSTNEPNTPPLRHLIKYHTNRSMVYREGQTSFEEHRAEENSKGTNLYHEFKNAENFEAAEWMLSSGITGLGSTFPHR